MVKNIDKSIITGLHGSSSPFELENRIEYQTWRDIRLENYRRLDPARVIPIADVSAMGIDTLSSLAQQIQAFNFVIFEIGSDSHAFSSKDLLTLGARLGLHRFESSADQELDGVTTLTVVDGTDRRSRYIPYSPRALNWHTDGYYYPNSQQIRSFLLYCQSPAAFGGGNFILDHEILYLQIREQAPDLLAALMEPDALVIPANIDDGVVTRAAESGPVFSIDDSTGQLAMRYSSRPRNIEWKANRLTKQAADLIGELLRENQYTLRLKLNQGQGLICRNVLHGRKAFKDGQEGENVRRICRVRYYDNPVLPGSH